MQIQVLVSSGTGPVGQATSEGEKKTSETKENLGKRFPKCRTRSQLTRKRATRASSPVSSFLAKNALFTKNVIDSPDLILNLFFSGVIDFFNAIEKHQSELKRKLEDAGPTELRQSKIIKDLKETDITDKIEDEQVKNSPFERFFEF